MNMGGGMVVSKGQDGSVDFSPKEITIANKLKEMADRKRAEQARSQTSDIDKNKQETVENIIEGESGESK